MILTRHPLIVGLLALAHMMAAAAANDNLDELHDLITAELPAHMDNARMPGYVGGVWHQGSLIQFARGERNVATGDPMTTDTAWLLGSVTKVLTTTMLLGYVEAGAVDLDAPVTRYLPDFTLAEPELADRITVRMLLNHSNGIDADALMPTREIGDRAVESYVAELATGRTGRAMYCAGSGQPRVWSSVQWRVQMDDSGNA